jgi:hypothetical protein
VLTYQATNGFVEFTATGPVSADEAAATFRAIRDDATVPEGLSWLMDLRQYDQSSMPSEDMPARVSRMFAVLGPKLGPFWALVIDNQIEHAIRGRLLQRFVQDLDATVMLFREVSEAREWLEAMTTRRAH